VNDKEKIVLLTALADGEIDNPNLKSELETFISSDSNAKFEFEVQSLMKSLVRNKIAFVKAPEKLHRHIKRKLLREVESPNRKILSPVFTTRYISYATVAVIIVAIVLIIFNRPPLIDEYNFAIEQHGTNNMFVQAQNNFSAIINGQLKPQLISDNPGIIKNYFEQNGVRYTTIIPEFDNLDLLGAVVSDEGGEKFAHHVYTTTDGKLVYLYQVDEETILEGDKITLTNDLVKYLDEGSCYSVSQNKTSLVFVKVKENICAVVSNLTQTELKDTFCSLN
jgi:hypothetical protein